VSATYLVVMECDCCPSTTETVEATSTYDAAARVRDQHIIRRGVRKISVTAYTPEQARRAGVVAS
jgi:hypothetical protein